jgi:hypothetical protein
MTHIVVIAFKLEYKILAVLDSRYPVLLGLN